MSVTNPPPIRVPQEFAKDRNTFTYFNELHTFLRLLWERTGGGTDAIAETTDASTLLLPGMSDRAAIAALREDARNLSVLSFSSDAAKIAALTIEVGELQRTVASLQSLHGKYATTASKQDVTAATLIGATPDAARYAHLEQRLNDLELLAWL